MAVFDQQLLGRKQGEALRAQLLASIDRERKSKALSNTAVSNEVCQRLEMVCTRQLDASAGAALPSMRQFEGSFRRCRVQFEVGGRGRLGRRLGAADGPPCFRLCTQARQC